MEIIVDGQARPVTSGGDQRFKALFDSIAASAAASKRVVVSISLDGKILSRVRQAELGPQPTPSTGRLEIVTANPYRLSIETLDGVAGLIGQVQELHELAAQQVIAAKYQDAMKSLDQCFECWLILVNAVKDVANTVSVDLRSVKLEGEPADARVRKVQDALVKFKEAFEKKDAVRLGDIAQYELAPLLSTWKELMEALRRHLAGVAGASR